MRNARAILIEIGFCLEKKENKKKRKKRKKEFVFRENEMSSPPARWKTDKHSWFIRGTTEPNRSETVRSSIRSSLFSLAIRRDAVRLRGYIRFCASPLLFNSSPYPLSLSLSPSPEYPRFFATHLFLLPPSTFRSKVYTRIQCWKHCVCTCVILRVSGV